MSREITKTDLKMHFVKINLQNSIKYLRKENDTNYNGFTQVA